MSIESPFLFVRVGSLTMCVIRNKPLSSIGNAYYYLGKASQIIKMRRNARRLVRSRGLRFESRSVANWSHRKLKADRPKIYEYLHVSWYDLLADTSRMRLAVFTLLTPIRNIVRYLAGVKHLTRSRTHYLFFETYHFCCWAEEPLHSVLPSQASPT
jgi:hypothetical protein